MALTGCNDPDSQGAPTTPLSPTPEPELDAGTPPTEPGPDTETPSEPEEPELPPPAKITGQLLIQSKKVVGDVTCEGQSLNDTGAFTFTAGQASVTCQFGNVDLSMGMPIAVSAPVSLDESHIANETLVSIDLQNTLGAQQTRTAATLLNKINTCPTETNKLCLRELDSYDISRFYNEITNVDDVENQELQEFLNPTVTEESHRQPSAHVDPTLTPEVTPGDSTTGFVSSAAEQALMYTPSADNKPLTRSQLTDADGLPVAGVEFFSQSSQGVTDADGFFEYLWGENLVFAIDTLTLGETRGNQLNYTLNDLSSNEVTQQNINLLLHRYGHNNGATLTIGESVYEVFEQYPNVINELINLSLPNGAMIEGTGFRTADEFEAQFAHGDTLEIDQALKQPSTRTMMPRTAGTPRGGYVSQSLHAIYKDVSAVHIFSDSKFWRGANGLPRAMRNFNISNDGFPVLTPRKDNNFWLPFGEEAAWSRGTSKSDKKAYIVDATTISTALTGITMERPPLINDETTIFDFPTIAAGMIGTGKMVFLGNGLYTSVLSCPDNYWASRELTIDGASATCQYRSNEGKTQQSDVRNDHGDMQRFFTNIIDWMVPAYQHGEHAINAATNITTGHAFKRSETKGIVYDFFVDERFNVGTPEQITSGGYGSLNPAETPLLLLQSFEMSNYRSVKSDVTRPKLTVDDVSALINYVNNGGNIIFFDALEESNPEPVARLADAGGVSIGGANVARLLQANCKAMNCSKPVKPWLHGIGEHDKVVYEFYDDTSLFVINDDGTMEWPKGGDMPSLAIPLMTTVDDKGNEVTQYASITVKTPEEKAAAIALLQQQFPGVPVCKDDYEYEVNCIEYRKGHGIPSHGPYERPEYQRYEITPEVVDTMVKAANLGANVNKLYQHELYYRTKGAEGVRLSEGELTFAYDNLSVWFWNDNQYRYNPNQQDELGFGPAVEMLNCYTRNQHGGGTSCSPVLEQKLKTLGMLRENGEQNPSYPLNWKEKPLTRIMLGRSYWDLDITVDTTGYPGRPTAHPTSDKIDIHTWGKKVRSAGNMQSTGFWAPQHGEVTVSGGVPATITTMLVDDLTGRSGHELKLKRPPRGRTTHDYDGSSMTFRVPYGALIYVKPKAPAEQDLVTFNFDGVLMASFWQDGRWLHPVNKDVPLAEIDTDHFIYTTPVNNVVGKPEKIEEFAAGMNRFANSASDFYGRDEVCENNRDTECEKGKHRRFTYEGLPGHRHRFVNDIQISIGSAHSGYPIQNSASWRPGSNKIPTDGVYNNILWHELGHNLASAPFGLPEGGEVTASILSLYMMERRPKEPFMGKLEGTLEKIELMFAVHNGHGWSEGVRLSAVGQLKLWAEDHFDINRWYAQGATKPAVYDEDQGWNLFKLAHRKQRGDTTGDDLLGRNGTNYCSKKSTKLKDGDLLLACMSYLSGYDLSDYFRQWNPGESKADLPDGSARYTGGMTEAGFAAVAAMKLPKPEKSPLKYVDVRQGMK